MNVGEWMAMEEMANLNAAGARISMQIPLKQMLIILRQDHKDNFIVKRLIQINGVT